MNGAKTFKLHWLHGDTEIIKGNTIAEAFMLAGYGGGAIRALDWYEECAANTKEQNGHYRPTTVCQNVNDKW